MVANQAGESDVLNLSDIERRILINQSRILAALYPLEALHFQRAVELLENGYYEAWHDVVLRGLKEPFPQEEMNFVYQVLNMYDWLQKSYYALSLDEKLQLREAVLVFPGFDARSEKEQLAYSYFLIENLERFSFVEVTQPLGTDVEMSHSYRRMLGTLPFHQNRMLTAGEIAELVATVTNDVRLPITRHSVAA